jgi:hypothetical protein
MATSFGGRFDAPDRQPWLTSIEVGPDVGATTSALLTDELWLDIRQPHFIAPAVNV